MNNEILDQIRQCVSQQITEVIEIGSIPQLEVHTVTQSYLLLQILVVNWVKLRRILGRMLGNRRECWESTSLSSVSSPRKQLVPDVFCKFGARPGDFDPNFQLVS